MFCEMPKERATYRLERDLLLAMKSLAKERRWNVTTVVEVALENLLKSTGHLDAEGKITDKVIPEETNEKTSAPAQEESEA